MTQLSLGTDAARNLATTTKTVPQMQGISSRWLLKMLPWVQVDGGTYRVNRRLRYLIGSDRVSFIKTGAQIRVLPPSLLELPALRGFDNSDILEGLASKFTQQEFEPGDVIVESGQQADRMFLIAHGKVKKIGAGEYDDQTLLGVLVDGDHFGAQFLTERHGIWDFTATAATSCTVLALPRQEFHKLVTQSEALRDHIEQFHARRKLPHNRYGEASIELASGHTGEPALPGIFVDYELSPREYKLSVAQTTLRVHTRVADLYNQPMNQVEQQLRLTIEAIRERQEHEMINNQEFGLLHNAVLEQRISTRTGPPTPDDLDELIVRRRKSRLLFAHPRTIAAFGRECNRQGVYPQDLEINGQKIRSWRGRPIFPCNKIPITKTGISSILCMRIGVEDEGVIGLHQTGIPDEVDPGLSVKFMGINNKAIASYLVSTYYSAALLVPNALGILENVEVFR